MHEMHRTRTRVAVLLTALALAGTLLAGCGPSATGNTPSTQKKTAAALPLTITDDAGRAVVFDKTPTRIVSLAPANTEIVYGLDLMDRLVGVTTFDDYPAGVKSIAKMGDFQTPNLEAIAAAKPDVVLLTGGVQADVLGKLEGLGAKVVVVDPKDVDGVYRAIDLLGRVLGVPDKATAVVAKMKADLADIERRVATEKPKRAFVEIGWNPLFTAGAGTLIGDVLTKAGGVNVVAQNGYVSYSIEELVKAQPDVYLGTKSSIGDPLALESRPGYSALSAVEAGSIYVLDDNLVSRPGPRIVDGVREIAVALHPDAFK
jgi:iron complex transport system substrate-binding protein